ncbi:hypothetical protein NDU88_011511 [Pleurodeles waltl]|uniref:Ig-like domain-containing protein n=1 Tax=Pleurodeles waltl TaxID=8319 RepID=A0AAV7PZ23_PLEWA|nr:hypothetical protein NDU88_011511 [Pleurodeles waltl]
MGLSCGPRGSLPWSHALKTLTLAVCLGVCILRASAQGAGAEVIDAAVGETATIPAPVTVKTFSFSWYRGTAVAASQLICTYFVSSPEQVNGPQYTGRESGRPDGALQIRDLRTNYTGNYTVNVIVSGASPVEATRQLRVSELVTKPTVKYVSSQLVENRGPVEITCDTPSVPVTIFWSFNGSQTLPGNIILSPDNRTLTISNVSRGDSGIYQCTALNPVSNSTSDPQTLTVAYGPENVKITPPGSQLLQVGNKLSLSCTAQSVPEVQYQWFLNDTNLNRPGNTYTVEKVSSQNYGNYTCVAHNTYTSLSANTSVFITVNGTDPSSGGSPDLSGGAIAGIVIGVLAVIIVVCVLVYIFVIKKPASGHPPEGSTTDAASSKNAASTNPKVNGTAEDIQYSSVNFMPKGSTPLKPISNENTVYSEVRRS